MQHGGRRTFDAIVNADDGPAWGPELRARRVTEKLRSDAAEQRGGAENWGRTRLGGRAVVQEFLFRAMGVRRRLGGLLFEGPIGAAWMKTRRLLAQAGRGKVGLLKEAAAGSGGVDGETSAVLVRQISGFGWRSMGAGGCVVWRGRRLRSVGEDARMQAVVRLGSG